MMKQKKQFNNVNFFFGMAMFVIGLGLIFSVESWLMRTLAVISLGIGSLLLFGDAMKVSYDEEVAKGNITPQSEKELKDYMDKVKKVKSKQ